MRIAILLLTLLGGLYAQGPITVLNGASNRVDQPVSPGSWATVYGAFTGVATAQATAVPLPKTLGGVAVSIEGVDAPVYFVSATQVNFLIPLATAVGRRAVIVRTAAASFNGTVRVINTAPGLFPKDTATPPKGAILNQDSSENTSGNPTRRGEVISIFATGPGAVTGTLADGANSPANPLATTVSTPQVFIDGFPATVQFSGMAPGLIGLWQINAVIPARALGGRTVVQVFQDGVDSNEVAIFVQQ